MKKEKISKWPFFGAILLYSANVDYIIIPLILKPLDLSFWSTFWIATLVANIEIIGGFYFWYWFAWTWLPTTERVKDTVQLTKSVIELLKEHGILGTIIYKIKETFKWAINHDGRLIRFIKRWEHPGMLILGAESFVSGGRLCGTIICASTKWRNGIYSLIIGNTVHVATSVGVWNLFFYLWSKHKELFLIPGAILIMYLAISYIWKILKK